MSLSTEVLRRSRDTWHLRYRELRDKYVELKEISRELQVERDASDALLADALRVIEELKAKAA